MDIEASRIAELLRQALTRTDVEQYVVLGLDENWQPLSAVVVGEGSDSHCPVWFRDIQQAADNMGAKIIVTGHSHVLPGKISEADQLHFEVLLQWKFSGLTLSREHYILHPRTTAFEALVVVG